MRSLTSYTIGLAGAGYTAIGIGTLIYPQTIMDLLAQPLAAVNVMSVSVLAFGGYYTLAAVQDNWPCVNFNYLMNFQCLFRPI
jgi:hypothetical protein